MPPSKFTNAEDQRKSERKRFEAKQRKKQVLGDKVKAREQRNPQSERYNSGDY